ncbi:MAG: hypothetical protein AAGD07_18850 [Planctomycetota bacterium]
MSPMSQSLVYVGCVFALQVSCVTATQARGIRTQRQLLALGASALVMAALLTFRLELLHVLLGTNFLGTNFLGTHGTPTARHWADNLLVCSLVATATWLTSRVFLPTRIAFFRFSIGHLLLITCCSGLWIALAQRLPLPTPISQINSEAFVGQLVFIAFWCGQFCLPVLVGIAGALTSSGLSVWVHRPSANRTMEHTRAAWLLLGGLISHVTWVATASGLQARMEGNAGDGFSGLVHSYGTVAIAMLALQSLLLVLPFALVATSRVIPRFARQERSERDPRTSTPTRPRCLVTSSAGQTQRGVDVRV